MRWGIIKRSHSMPLLRSDCSGGGGGGGGEILTYFHFVFTSSHFFISHGLEAPAAFSFPSPEQSECDFSKGVTGCLEACGCYWTVACSQLHWGACHRFHLHRNEPGGPGQERRQPTLWRAHADYFPLTSHPELSALIPDKGSPSVPSQSSN